MVIVGLDRIVVPWLSRSKVFHSSWFAPNWFTGPIGRKVPLAA